MSVAGIALTGQVGVQRPELTAAVVEALSGGGRFAGLLGAPRGDGSFELQAVIATTSGFSTIATRLPAGELAYPSLSLAVPAASWYERELHDRYGVEPVGHPRLDPLVLPLPDGDVRPALQPDPLRPATPDPGALEAHASGEGMFTIPYGPVRSGVFEAVEYLVETFGEDIPRLRTRVHHKHRAVDVRFLALDPDDGVLLAERVEGTASVAHAIGYCRALEELGSTPVPAAAELVRVVHAELERIVNHLESMIRHTEGSYQAVANARLALHKERLMRLRAELCGNRFGRNVVVPGGVSGPLRVAPGDARRELERIGDALAGDTAALMATPSFLDRLRGAGVLPPEAVVDHGALGPVGRGSGLADDTRSSRPYGAYPDLGFRSAGARAGGDALARQAVRSEELEESFRLAGEALEELAHERRPLWREGRGPLPDGAALVAVEAPQGELLYLVEVAGGRLDRVKPRPAAFHNFALFPRAFRGDIFTDFVFIEASFGLSIAGVAG